MNGAADISGFPLLKARLEKIRRITETGRDWQATFLKWGTPKLEEDETVVFSFSPEVDRNAMEPFLAELSRRVEFPISGEYQPLPRAEAGHDQADESSPATYALRIMQNKRLGPLPLGTRPNGSSHPQTTLELVSEKNVEKKSSSKRSGSKTPEKAKRQGAHQDIKASESFRKLPPDARGILSLMYGFSHFDRATSRRTCKVSRNGLAELQRVTPRTVTNAWNNLERSFLVMRLKRGDRHTGVSVFELPYNYSHVCLWRMQAGGKRRY